MLHINIVFSACPETSTRGFLFVQNCGPFNRIVDLLNKIMVF